MLKCKLNALQRTIPYTVIKKECNHDARWGILFSSSPSFYYFFCNYQFMRREYKKFQVTIIFHLYQIYDRYKNTGYRDTHRLCYTGGGSLVSGHSDDHSINTAGTDAPTPSPPRSWAKISLPDYHSFLNYFEHTSEPTHFRHISSRLLGAECRGMLMRLVWH